LFDATIDRSFSYFAKEQNEIVSAENVMNRITGGEGAIASVWP
jgi:hypothetical protein